VQPFEILRLHTGKPPDKKSLRTAVVDCDDRVSTRKLEKQGSWVTPTAAKAAVRSTPPSKNKGDASDPSHELLTAPEFVVAQ
jgi:hypothetical protein